MEEEYTVRAASSSELARKKYILGKFPTQAPNITPKQGQWSLQRNDQDGNQQLVLQRDKPNQTKYIGRTDGGLVSSAPSNYFLLVRSGKEFITMPVSEWATFKQEGRRLPLQLEEAEAQMKFQRLQAERINPRLAKAIDGDPSSPTAAALHPAAEDVEADSDEEWKDIKARAASRATIDRTSSRGGNTAGNTSSRGMPTGNGMRGDDDEYENPPPDADGIYIPRPRDAEDWEHESEAADDDLDMGGPSDEEEEEEEAGVDIRRGGGQRATMSDSDGDMDARKVERTIKRMMQNTGLEDSDATNDDDDEEEEEEEDGEEEDEEDLDKMALELLDGGGQKSSPIAGATKSQSGVTSKKRKTPPILSPAPSQGTSVAGGTGGTKKIKTSPSQPSTGSTLSITEEEVVTLLKQHGGEMPLSEVGKHFKSRVTNSGEKVEFGKLLKRVVNMKPGQGSRKETYVVLKSK